MNKMETRYEWMNFMPMGIIFFDENFNVIEINQFAEKKLFCNRTEVMGYSWDSIFPHFLENELKRGDTNIFQFTFAEESFIAKISSFHSYEKSGFNLFFQEKKDIERFTDELESYQNLVLDLKTIFETSYDVLYVADGEGRTMRVSAACERLWGCKESYLVGKTAYQLEAEEVFKPSVTRLVLETKEKVSVIQTTKTGKRLMVVGTPIKDSHGNIVRVVNASRDITEVKEMESEIELLKQMTEGYKLEIEGFRTREEIEKKIIFRSEKMNQVVNFSRKIAKVDSAVLLLGEHGTGKEAMASFIHKWSYRKNHPFISLDCGSMPSELLETELFGDEEKENKMGLLKMANSGTLFLGQIEEMPMSTQTKLLKILQKQGAQNGNLNLRIVTASSKNLKAKVENGTFREDLYYMLNVVPISIPPLRERKEDIIPLIIHFTDQLNRKYKEEKKYSPILLKELQEYSWPGNVQELQNIIERLFVTSEGMWIKSEDLPDHIKIDKVHEKSIKIDHLMPLKDAVELLEKELLKMAKQKYESTTKIAEVLEVNQSTISRKIRKYKII